MCSFSYLPMMYLWLFCICLLNKLFTSYCGILNNVYCWQIAASYIVYTVYTLVRDSVLFTIHSVQCAVFYILHKVYSAQCTMIFVLCIIIIIHCLGYTVSYVLYTVYKVQSAVCCSFVLDTQYTVCCVICTICTVKLGKNKLHEFHSVQFSKRFSAKFVKLSAKFESLHMQIRNKLKISSL